MTAPVAPPTSPLDRKAPAVLVCDSRISQVAVYARGAVVTRQLLLPSDLLPNAELELIIEDITALAEPGSFRAALAGSQEEASAAPWQIVSVRSALNVPKTPATASHCAARLAELSGREDRIAAELDRLGQQRRQLAQAVPDPALRVTSLSEKVDERIADALATAALLSQTQAQLDLRLAQLEHELETVQTAQAAARLEHQQARGAANLSSGQPTRRAIIALSTPAVGSGRAAWPAITLSYVVPAARFWPRYTLRIVEGRDGSRDAGRRATWQIEALVAQRSGEDWTAARLSLSTADLLLDARLPELPSLRLGRAQPKARRGYRPPPAGLDDLFADYDAAFTGRSPPSLRSPLGELLLDAPEPLRSDDVDDSDGDDEQAERAKDILESTVPAVAAAPSPKKAMSSGGRPPPSPARPAAPGGRDERERRVGSAMRGGANQGLSEQAATLSADGAYGGGGAVEGDSGDPGEPASLDPADTWLDFDRLLLAENDDRSRRGRLTRSIDSAGLTSARHANELLESLHPGDGLTDPQDSRGHFDHRYDAAGLVLVPSDGLPHRVAITSADTVPTLRLIAVPQLRAEVYREAELKNPSEAPLLAGPVDVYVEGSLLTTAAIAATDRGGSLSVGMGVEDRLRIARNVRSDEETVGLLGGSTQVTSHVSIELSSALGQQCVVEVFERLPVSDDKSLTIELVSARPEAKEYSQAERGSPIRGGLVWRLLLAAGGKGKIDYQYRVSFPARTEIVGGNRRD